MTAKIGVRELTRNFNILENYDYVEVEDKKTHTARGLFVSVDFAEEVKQYIDKKLKASKQLALDEMMELAGKGSIEKRFDTLTSKEIKQKIAEEKYAH